MQRKNLKKQIFCVKKDSVEKEPKGKPKTNASGSLFCLAVRKTTKNPCMTLHHLNQANHFNQLKTTRAPS